ncbi:MAG: alpha/beta fold hydrolase [Saprospiraceae bacterium]|nr:alpha/beta fold hydrolase [Saprospiraceae bacterium]MCF8250886.1 alpha/beta fold hydrolase [Saprospiraceae bacterium]MCF8281142.1 alpha/beta fold hydrolase [Bacteroidales bacterium]MCF8312713.1 alpha/beta fold hydrolase [Saprospiraceae bacterium]MCF8441160.1 alpha/beta fold hydrolase [Saprospiraceae bacterium]
MKYLLLLHGALGSETQMEPLAELLQNDVEVFTLNFSGHGGAPFAAAFGIETFTAEVLDFLNENGLEMVDIYGYSMGGYVALNLAQLHPGRVGKIITLATKFDWTPESAERESKMLDPNKIEAKIPAFADLLQMRHAPNDWKVLLGKTAEMMLELGQQPVLTPAILSKIHHPALICLGDSDQMVSLGETSPAAAALPKGQFELLVQTPHPIEKVNLDTLVLAIRPFLLK